MRARVNTIYLWIIYFIMAGVCVYLTIDSQADIQNIRINVALFIVAFIIFYMTSADLKKVIKIRKDLYSAIETIENDHSQSTEMLLENYLESGDDSIFPTASILQSKYKDYLQEMKRVYKKSDGYSKCDINDYLNYEYIDSTARKNVINNVAGALTGLGILGTFWGLTIGLQNFSTGTTAEIEKSIPELMNGIKIAFHTSIYGMVFSLVFNYIYKAIMESAYEAMDEFLRVFNLYVCSDIETDNESNIQKSIGAFVEEFKASVYENFMPIFSRMADSLDAMQKDIELQPAAIGNQMTSIVLPELEKINQGFEKFAGNVAAGQKEELSALIDKFVEMMNQSLGDNFAELGNVISNTAAMQNENNEMIKYVTGRLKDVSENIVKVNELSELTIENMSSYIEKIEGLQDVIGENFMNVNIQLEDQQKYDEEIRGYINEIVEYENKITKAVNNFSDNMSAQLKAIEDVQDEIAKHTDENLRLLSDNSINYTKKLTEVAEENIVQIGNITKNVTDGMEQQIITIEGAHSNFVKMSDKSLATISESAEKCSEKIANVAEESITKIMNIREDNIDGLNAAADGLKLAASGLKDAVNKTNEDVVDSLNEIINQFDKELEKMIQHLSGTLTSMNSTVQNVPPYVRQTLEDMDKVFNALNDKLKELNNRMEVSKDTNSKNKKKED